MTEAVIVDGVRTPIARAGKDKTYYKDIRADDLGELCVRELLRRSPQVNPAEIDDDADPRNAPARRPPGRRHHCASGWARAWQR